MEQENEIEPPKSEGDVSKKRSGSLDTLLLVSAVVIVLAMLAWLFMGEDEPAPVSVPATIATAPPGMVSLPTVQAVSSNEVDVEDLLQRARLAADAGMLVQPTGSNALQYYLAVQAELPDDEEVNAEFDELLNLIGKQIEERASQGDFARADFLAKQLALGNSAHPALSILTSSLEKKRRSLREQILALATAGEQTSALRVIEQLEALPGTDALSMSSLESEVQTRVRRYREAQASARRQAAASAASVQSKTVTTVPSAEKSSVVEDQPEQTANQAAVDAEAEAELAQAVDPFIGFRSALARGDLSSKGDGAGAHMLILTSESVPAAQLASARADLGSAMASAINSALSAGDLAAADAIFSQWSASGLEASAGTRLQAAIDQAFVREATAEMVPGGMLRRTNVVAPTYPRSALRRGIEGRVRVEFTVAGDGSVTDIEVVEAPGGTVLHKATINAVSQWRYEPRVVRGKPVDQRVYSFVDFNLE